MQGMSFGEWMKERRRVLNLTQAELADRVGCASETIQKLETGRRRPSGQMAELLADRLSFTGDERTAFLVLARCDLAKEQFQRASELYSRVLASYWELGDMDFALRGACGIARTAEEHGERRTAATIFAALVALDPGGYPQGYLYDGAPAGTVQAGASGRAPASGRAMSLDELVDYGLQVAEGRKA